MVSFACGMHRFGLFRAGVWFLFFGMMAGCGYGFSGSGRLPEGVQAIFVSQMTDRVGEAGLGSRLTEDLVYVLMRSSQGRVADDITTADALLEGEIRSLSQTALARTAADQDIERRLTLTVFFVLKSPEGRVLWQREMQESEVHGVASDKAATENRRQEALETLSLRMAETLVQRMGDDF